jgi:hypothetical protein
MVKEGSKWFSNDMKRFVVLGRIEKNGNVWIHYRSDDPKVGIDEFSCYEESFLSRFTQDHSI